MKTMIRKINKALCALLSLALAAVPFTANADITFVHPDHLGSPIALTDSEGNLLAQEFYTPYGESVPPANTNDTVSYTGHYRDGDTGLVYMQARYYDPEIGRFLSVDPVTFSPDKPQQFNRYWYANGNPYLYTDPAGNYADAIIEAASLTLGVKSLAENVSAGNYGAATVDAVGLAVDGALTAIPFAPGGVGLAINAYRGADSAIDGVNVGGKTIENGAEMGTSDALDVAQEALGKGYSEAAPGVFRSADGSTQVRMTDSDLAKTGNHAGAPHINIEQGRTVMKANGKQSFVSEKNVHVYLPEEK